MNSVGRVGEPWTFGLVPDETSSYLAERGFHLVWDVSTAEAGVKYFGPLSRRDRASQLYRVASPWWSAPSDRATAAARRRRISTQPPSASRRDGVHATTMQDICAYADLSTGAVYCWFDSKEAIIAAVADDRHAREQHILRDATEDPNRDMPFTASSTPTSIGSPSPANSNAGG